VQIVLKNERYVNLLEDMRFEEYPKGKTLFSECRHMSRDVQTVLFIKNQIKLVVLYRSSEKEQVVIDVARHANLKESISSLPNSLISSD